MSPVKPITLEGSGLGRAAGPMAASGLIIWPALAWWATQGRPGWLVMWAVAGSEFLALKLLTLAGGEWKAVPLTRVAAYVALWPGMDVGRFLSVPKNKVPLPGWSEGAWAIGKMACGIIACAWAALNVARGRPELVGWVGMIGIIFVLHFGLLHLDSWIWRRLGVDARPIMRAPIAADSLAAFWGERWNAAFADAARRLLFRPLARRLGARGAGGAVFLVSGLVHESVISLPARGGWGGPTAYFLLQGAGVFVEKSRIGKTMGLGAGLPGWIWMALCTAGPLPLLFHQPFLYKVILPFFQTINQHLP